MTQNWRIAVTSLLLLGDLCRVMLIDRPRQPITRGDVAVGLCISFGIIGCMWWPS